MSDSNEASATTRRVTGGCQCGAVRFRAEVDAGRASICHCRMCQKAVGNVFAALVPVHGDTLVWTKAEPKRWRSSSHGRRGFCAACGTPLTYEAPDGVALSIGAFDEPGRVPPAQAYGIEGKLAWSDGLADLPQHHTLDDVASAPFLAELVSNQHPDRPDDDERA